MANEGANDRLIKAIAEQLKLPLLQISRIAELARMSPDPDGLENITDVADNALRMVDGFLLGLELYGEKPLRLEPVSISSVLAEAAHILHPIAKQNDCDISISLKGKYGPAMAHRQGLESALLLIGQSLMEGRAQEVKRHEIVLGAHLTQYGLVAGVFDNQPGLTSDVFRRGRALFGNARQAMPSASASNGAGIFVADSLLKTMDSSLRVAKHRKLTGLAATFHLSSQLQLI